MEPVLRYNLRQILHRNEKRSVQSVSIGIRALVIVMPTGYTLDGRRQRSHIYVCVPTCIQESCLLRTRRHFQ
jgi:hypothetical protein